MYLFDVNVPGSNEVYCESDSIEPSNDMLVIDTPFGRMGVENLCYVIAPNQGGFHLNGRKTFGRSIVAVVLSLLK